MNGDFCAYDNLKIQFLLNVYDINCINVLLISQDWEICNLANLLTLPVGSATLSYFSKSQKSREVVLEFIHSSKKCSPWHMEDQADFIKAEVWIGNKTDISKKKCNIPTFLAIVLQYDRTSSDWWCF